MLQRLKSYNKFQIATLIALAFHVSGFIAIALFKSELFISLTPLNLIICTALIYVSQTSLSKWFIAFSILAIIIGFSAEWVGINTGFLFGNYTYGKTLGYKWQGVPLLIGFQWFVTLYCIGCAMHMLVERLKARNPLAFERFPKWWMVVSLIGDGALIAVIFDWILEPVAVKLNFWTWADGQIPMMNYYSWWAVSCCLLAIFHFLPFHKQNIFAVHLLLIQTMFFLLLRTFL